MPNNDYIELKLRIKRSRQQGEGKLLEYMMNHPTLSSTEAVLSACRAYWMPLAIASAGESNATVRSEIGWRAVLELEMQIQLIKRVLQLESPSSGYAQPVMPAMPAMPVAVAPVAPTEATPTEALAFSVSDSQPSVQPDELDDDLGVNDF